MKQKYLDKLSGILGVDEIFKPVAATEYEMADNAFHSRYSIGTAEYYSNQPPNLAHSQVDFHERRPTAQFSGVGHLTSGPNLNHMRAVSTNVLPRSPSGESLGRLRMGKRKSLPTNRASSQKGRRSNSARLSDNSAGVSSKGGRAYGRVLSKKSASHYRPVRYSSDVSLPSRVRIRDASQGSGYGPPSNGYSSTKGRVRKSQHSRSSMKPK